MSYKRPWPSFETPRKRAAPQDDGNIYLSSHTSSNRRLLYWLLLCGLKFLT
jgi:hypothetical protein